MNHETRNEMPPQIPDRSLRPLWSFDLQGRLDARCGENKCLSTVENIYARGQELKDREILNYEELLTPLRRDVVENIAEYRRSQDDLNSLRPMDGDTPKIIRHNRSLQRRQKALQAKCDDIENHLLGLNEAMIFYHAELEQYLEQLRHHTETILRAYLSGVRSRLHDFSPPAFDLTDEKLEQYRQRHAQLTEQLAALLDTIWNRKENTHEESKESLLKF